MEVHLRIYGQVQGVFFRREAKTEADRLGITGWVRNDRDGSVEAVASGPRAKVDQFVKWCKRGPALAKVERVEEDWQDRAGGYDSFEIADE